MDVIFFGIEKKLSKCLPKKDKLKKVSVKTYFSLITPIPRGAGETTAPLCPRPALLRSVRSLLRYAGLRSVVPHFARPLRALRGIRGPPINIIDLITVNDVMKHSS